MKPYKPADGTAGGWFLAAWCVRCKHCDGCDVLAEIDDLDDPVTVYPAEWIQDESGPRCTAFEMVR